MIVYFSHQKFDAQKFRLKLLNQLQLNNNHVICANDNLSLLHEQLFSLKYYMFVSITNYLCIFYLSTFMDSVYSKQCSWKTSYSFIVYYFENISLSYWKCYENVVYRKVWNMFLSVKLYISHEFQTPTRTRYTTFYTAFLYFVSIFSNLAPPFYNVLICISQIF